MSKKMTAAFLTLGCKVNYYETEKMMQQFQKKGFEIREFIDRADVYVVNTCTVTNIADRKSRQMLHRAKKKNPDSLVVAAGCFVESAGEAVLADEMVDAVFLNKEKSDIAEQLLRKFPTYFNKIKENTTEVENKNTRKERTRAYVKIQDGCNQFCSYCLIPYVRGKGTLSSTPPEEVVSQIGQLVKGGYKEVVLTGIHLSSYGIDLSDEKNFVKQKGRPLLDLIHRVAKLPGLERIRFGSLEPRIISEEFLESLAKEKKICPHFHLSLQSGCDSVLRRMNRHYTAVEYEEKVTLIRKYFEMPAITTDVIVGFPGETEEEFEKTRQFLAKIRFSDIHVFKYSPRNGTKAAGMENQVPPEVKNRRSEILIADTKKYSREYGEYFTGREEAVLFEELVEMEDGNYLVGYNERYVRIGVPEQEAATKGYRENEIHRVTVKKWMGLKK